MFSAAIEYEYPAAVIRWNGVRPSVLLCLIPSVDSLICLLCARATVIRIEFSVNAGQPAVIRCWFTSVTTWASAADSILGPRVSPPALSAATALAAATASAVVPALADELCRTARPVEDGPAVEPEARVWVPVVPLAMSGTLVRRCVPVGPGYGSLS